MLYPEALTHQNLASLLGLSALKAVTPIDVVKVSASSLSPRKISKGLYNFVVTFMIPNLGNVAAFAVYRWLKSKIRVSAPPIEIPPFGDQFGDQFSNQTGR